MKITIGHEYKDINGIFYRYHNTNKPFTTTNNLDDGIVVEQKFGYMWVPFVKLKNINEVNALLKSIEFKSTKPTFIQKILNLFKL